MGLRHRPRLCAQCQQDWKTNDHVSRLNGMSLREKNRADCEECESKRETGLAATAPCAPEYQPNQSDVKNPQPERHAKIDPIASPAVAGRPKLAGVREQFDVWREPQGRCAGQWDEKKCAPWPSCRSLAREISEVMVEHRRHLQVVVVTAQQHFHAGALGIGIESGAGQCFCANGLLAKLPGDEVCVARSYHPR